MLFIPEEKRLAGMEWAQRMLGNPQAVIIDTETTGLSGSAEMVQLAIIGIDVYLAERSGRYTQVEYESKGAWAILPAPF